MAEQLIDIYEMLQHQPDAAYLPKERQEAFALHPDKKALILVVGDFRLIDGSNILEYMAQQIALGKFTTIGVEEFL